MTNSSVSSTTGAAELFHMLESNKLRDVEETKKVFHDHFLSTKDNWLVNGLFEYYLSTDSLRAVEVLASVREPHDKHLFDKLSDTLAAKLLNNGQKVRSLTLLGHVARRQPTWLHKLTNHTLFRQLLHIIRMEEEIVLLMSALFLLITLLPMLPTAVTPHLPEIFEVFSRLASFYYHRFLSVTSGNSTTVSTTSLNLIGGCSNADYFLLHLQVGLYNLFHRLYAMYPCNFVYFLKQQYGQRDQLLIFKKIISPLIDSVRMHPLLVTMSKDSEISSSRWKKMEHHDVIAECGRFSLFERACRDEAVSLSNMRFTPISDYSCPYTPINTNTISVDSTGLLNGSQESFWSPSMVVSASSPPPPNSMQATPISQYDSKSTPSTPGGGFVNVTNSGSGSGSNVRSRTSPPEAAVEATPETTPVKDLRQMPNRQLPHNSAAVRALSGLGNGSGLLNSRPATPSSNNQPLQQQTQHHPLQLTSPVPMFASAEGSSILNRKLGNIVAERQSAALRQEQPLASAYQDESKRSMTSTPVMREQINAMLNGKMDWHQHSQLEDQEVSNIISSTKFNINPCLLSDSDGGRHALNDLSKTVRQKFFCGHPTPIPYSQDKRRTKSCPDMIIHGIKCVEVSTQTCDVLPYEIFLYDILDQHHQSQIDSTSTTPAICGTYPDSRLSPSAMLERYIEVCARNVNHTEMKQRSSIIKPIWSGIRRKNDEELENGQHSFDESNCESGTEIDRFNQQIQLMQMQLQFERHRREVHAERNRRLLGKLRDSRGLEELNSAMTSRLKRAEGEVESLKSELINIKQELLAAENKLSETIRNCQSECKDEQQRNTKLKVQIEIFEEELKNEKNKALECEKQTRAAEATLFEAVHQLKEALRAANQSEELKRTLDAVQKRFLLLGEAQARIQEKMGAPVHMARQEVAQIQRSWSEEVSNLRRQLDSQTLQMETLKSRLNELEHKDARKEDQLVEQQKLLQDSKEKHSAELEAVESKYKAQLEINLLLESRILELYGKLEQATFGSSASGSNLASSISPKERSPPLSASLASSSEGSLAFIHSAINDCSGEISNLQAIVEPVPIASTSGTGQKSSQG